MPRINEIIYPIFLEASQYAKDEYWVFLIQELAYGNAPYGIYIDSEQLLVCANTKGKQSNLSFSDISAEKLFSDALTFFRKLGLRSNQEYIEQNMELKQMYTTQYSNWIDIKKKYIKELLIYNYVIDLKNKYSLTHHQMKLLLSNIMLWFQFKLLTKYDVEYDPKSCRILQIKDLFITKKGRIRLNRDLENILLD